MGIYVVDCASFEDALAATEELRFDTGSFEIRPLVLLDPGVISRTVRAKSSQSGHMAGLPPFMRHGGGRDLARRAVAPTVERGKSGRDGSRL